MSHSIILIVKLYERNYGDPIEKFDVWRPRLSRSLKIIGTDADRSVTYELLLTFPSNNEPISYRFQDKRRFFAKFPNPVYLAARLWCSR